MASTAPPTMPNREDRSGIKALSARKGCGFCCPESLFHKDDANALCFNRSEQCGVFAAPKS